MKARWHKYDLRFIRTARTSRGVLNNRTVWYLFLEKNGTTGTGECAPLPGLSRETSEQVEHLLNEICKAPEDYLRQPDLTADVP